MMGQPPLLGRTLLSGTAAAAASVAALALAARLAGKGALQPINATSHWLHGRSAAEVRVADLAHTGVGYATHHAACLFWAVLFEVSLGEERRPAALARAAVGTAVVAAGVDYLATPKRSTPGWEYVLRARGMVGVYAALAAGLAAGAGLRRGHPAPGDKA